MNETTRKLNERIQGAIVNKLQKLIDYFAGLSYMDVPSDYFCCSYSFENWRSYEIQQEILNLKIISIEGEDGYINLPRLQSPLCEEWNETEFFIYGETDDEFCLFCLDFKRKKIQFISPDEISQEWIEKMATGWIKNERMTLENMSIIE